MADKTAEEELELLERVFLRLGAAQTDEQLEKTVGTFLTPLLLKVASLHDAVKKKVMEILTHINKRVKSRPKVQLPVDALLQQYQDPTISPFITNFTILYLRMGVPRLDIDKQVEIVPLLIQCLHRRPVPQQDCILQLVIPVLGLVKVPQDLKQRDKMFIFKEKPDVAKLFLDFILDVLLMPYSLNQNSNSQEDQTSEDEPGNSTGVPSSHTLTATPIPPDNTSQPTGPPPGLSNAAVKKIMGDQPIQGDSLEKVKLGILQFLSKDIFQPSDMICHFVVATGDSRHSIGDFADHELKRVASSTDWENAEVVNKMFSTYLGTVVTPGTNQAAVPADQKRSPANIRVKQKIFPYLLRSRRATEHFPACIQVSS